MLDFRSKNAGRHDLGGPAASQRKGIGQCKPGAVEMDDEHPIGKEDGVPVATPAGSFRICRAVARPSDVGEPPDKKLVPRENWRDHGSDPIAAGAFQSAACHKASACVSTMTSTRIIVIARPDAPQLSVLKQLPPEVEVITGATAEELLPFVNGAKVSWMLLSGCTLKRPRNLSRLK